MGEDASLGLSPAIAKALGVTEAELGDCCGEGESSLPPPPGEPDDTPNKGARCVLVCVCVCVGGCWWVGEGTGD